MNYKLVPKQLTDSMAKVLRNEHCVYQTEQELYDAMLEAAPAAPVELEPMAYMASSGTCITAEDVSYTPNWTDYYTTPLVRQSDAAAVIAAKDAEIERLKEERLGVISQSKMHPSWLEKSREEILDCLRFQGATTAVLLVETADLRKQLAAADKQRDELLAALEKQFADAKHCQQVMLNEVGIGFLDVVTLDASEEAIARMKGAA